ncbi:MAG: hemerythrin domain-containing protein [Acidobacteria bacterium]|nr:hemerythrin domain-containing protein [Acidobacteriota bacterium]
MITIGKKSCSDFSDPLAMMNDCHRKIERLLSGLQTIMALTHGGPLSSAHRPALELGLRYFKDAAPYHARDEEESLFPRMRKSPNPEAQAAIAVLDALDAEHVEAESGHAVLEALGRKWLTEGSLNPEEAAQLESVVNDLAVLYTRHIAIEDTEVFPLAARVLTAEELKEVGVEMAARRTPQTQPIVQIGRR